jgi:hypothetical protein
VRNTNNHLTKDDSADLGWRHFPYFEEILEQERPADLLTKVEKTCRQLNDVLQSGTQVEKTRAKQAMTAYGRSLDLLKLLTQMRDEAAQG